MKAHTLRPKDTLTVTDNIVDIRRADNTQMEIFLDEVTKISFLTSDKGPFFDDLALVLFNPESVMLIPSGHASYEVLYEAVKSRFDLDYAAHIEAMSSTQNAEFVIWEK